MVNAHKNGLTY